MSQITRRALPALLGLPLLATAARAQVPDRVSARLDWSTWGVHAPFHLALAKGWFERHGIAASFEDGNGSVSTVQLVGNGQFDIGHAALGPMIMARGRGVPVRAVATFMRQNDIGVMLPEGAGITTIAALRGKRLAYTPGSLETPFIDRFLAAGGLKRDDVELLSVDAAGKVGLYVNNRADGMFSTIPFTLPSVRAQRASSTIRFADHGLAFPSFGLFATERAIAEKGPALGRFASVVAGAWAYILDGHEDEAVRAVVAARPQSRLQPAVLREQIELIRGYVATEATKGQPIGPMAEADWAEAAANLAAAGQIPKAEAADTYFTNTLLDTGIIADVAKGATGAAAR
jgi:NitT/TauT family transport system substrate-binding protein